MPKVSRDSAAHVEDHGPVEDRHEDLDGLHGQLRHVQRGHRRDAAAARASPDDRCQCPHWGYVFKGRLTFRFADHEEVFEPGDAFYVPPGHTPVAEAGTESVMFSPAEALHEVSETMARNMAAMAQSQS